MADHLIPFTEQELDDAITAIGDARFYCSSSRALDDQRKRWRIMQERLQTMRSLKALRALCLDMGRVIRRLDDDHEHLEMWTQDGDYVIDGRFAR